MALPITRHASGRAAPLPVPAPQSAPEPETAEPSRVVIPECRDSDPDVTTVLTGGTGAGETAAAAARFRRASQLARERAEGDQAEADQVMADARAQVAEIMRSAGEASSVLSKSASQAAREAEELGDRSRWLATAAGELAKAERAEAAAGDLQAERDRLGETAGDLAGRIAALGAEREQLGARMDAARGSGDLEDLAALRSRDSAAADVAASLTAQRNAALARIAEIGEPDWPHSPLPPLAEALRGAEGARAAARRALNAVWPARPEAVADARRAGWLATMDALRDGAVAAQRKPPQPRTLVHLE